MKELSIEQKAQRYDEAIKIAKDSFTYPDYPGFIRADVVFPELKESEDEKTRKDIISFVEQAIDAGYGIISKERKEEWIAWLEKQGKLMKALQISNARIGELIEKNYNMGISEATRKKLEDNLNKALEKETPESCNEFLEKQDEQDNNEDVAILHRFSFYSYKDEPNILYLAGLYVNDKYRNKGIGTKILEVTDKVAKSLNCHTIRLKTKKGGNAERLYRTHGYNSLATEESDEIWLEKKGEQKLYGTFVNVDDVREDFVNEVYRVLDADPTNDRANQIINAFDSLPTLELEKQSEQKSADEIEPKFHEGDWVVYNHDICQIVKREEGCNKLVTVFGIEKELVNERNLSTAHLWSIQDAKDGDILCTYECNEPKIIFILKGTPKKNYALDYYCYYNIMYPHFESDSEKGCLSPNDEDVKPATKEQRNLLFQKMKELKKEEVYNLHNYLYGKQDPIWSEEDKDYYDAIIAKLGVTQEDAALTDNQMNFLKSLRERYTWKPSDEQMDAVKDAIDYLGENTKIVRKHLMSLYEQLKKLREE